MLKSNFIEVEGNESFDVKEMPWSLRHYCKGFVGFPKGSSHMRERGRLLEELEWISLKSNFVDFCGVKRLLVFLC